LKSHFPKFFSQIPECVYTASTFKAESEPVAAR